MILLFALLQFGCSSTYKEVYKKKIEIPSGSQITLKNINGSVEVQAWDEEAVFIEAVKKVEGTNPRIKEKLDEIRINITQSDHSVKIETDAPSRDFNFWEWLFGEGFSYSVSYKIKVPRHSNLKIEVTNGAIHVADVKGHIRLSGVNGRVFAENVGGSVKASTVNGAVEVSFDSLGTTSGMEFSTTNGGITLALPEDARCTIKASTTNGSIETDFPLEIHGRFVSKSLKGTINGGGPLIELSTVNGSIEILKRGKGEERE